MSSVAGSDSLSMNSPVGTLAEPVLAVVFQAISKNAWEAIVIAVALYMFLATNRFVKRASAAPKRRDASDLKRKGVPAKKSTRAQTGDATSDKTASMVRNLVASLMRPSADGAAVSALRRYEELTRDWRVDLRQHLADEEARILYIGLVGASAREIGGISRVPELIAHMRSFGFPRGLSFYTSVMKIHASSNHAEGMLRLHAEMQRDGTVPDRAMYQCLMQAAVAVDACDQALEFFNALLKMKPPPSIRTYMTALSIHAKRGDWLSAVALLKGMKPSGVEPDNLVLNNVIGLCVSAGQVDQAEVLAKDFVHATDVVSYNILLKGYSQQTDLAKAEGLLQKMLADGPEPTLISFNTVMDCSVRTLQVTSNGEDQRRSRRSDGYRRDNAFGRNGTQATGKVSRTLWELLDLILARRLTPDRYTLATLAKSMHLVGCNVTDIDRVVKLLQTLGPDAMRAPGEGNGGHKTGGTPRLLEVLFNTLLDLCVRLHDLDRMGAVFQMMSTYVEVSSVTYGTLIKAFGQAGRLARCKEVWEEMLQKGLTPSVVTFGCYIDACARDDDLDGAVRTLESMSAIGGIPPNAVIYTSVMRGLARVGQCDAAFDLYRQMRSKGITGTLVTFNSVLSMVSQQIVDREKFDEVTRDMRDSKISPNTMSLSIMLKAHVAFGNLDLAMDLFKETCSKSAAPDTFASNALLVALARAGRATDSEEVLAGMLRDGTAPTNAAVASVVKMYGKAQQLERAFEFSEHLKTKYARIPNVFLYTCLIQACMQNGQLARSLGVFIKMLQEGVEPDTVIYGAMVRGCVNAGWTAEAMSFVRNACLTNAPPGCKSLEAPWPAKPVIVPPDALAMLTGMLRRKRHDDLANELEAITVMPAARSLAKVSTMGAAK